MRQRTKLLLIGGCALVALAGTGVLLLRPPPSASASSAVAVPRPGAIAALGRIEPQSETFNLGGATTDVLADLSVQRGSRVARGQVIGHFRGHGEAVARARAVAQQLAEARAQLEAEKALGESRIRAAQTLLDGTLAVGPARIESQVARLRAVEIELANNVDILNGSRELKRSEFASRRTLEDQRAAVERLRADLVGARARLDELRRQFESDRSNAEAALAVERATTLRTQAQIPVASLEQQLGFAEAQVLATSLVAPIDGTILNLLVRPGEAVANNPILALGNTEKMHAVAEVYETDVPRVRLGQRARITSPALQMPLTGQVVEIGRMIFKNDVLNVDPAARADARVVQVRIEIEDGSAVVGLTNLAVDVVISEQAGIADAGTPAP